jgi:signal transduction histidine kinase
MNPEAIANLVRFVDHDSTIICLTFNKEGIILDSNNFAESLFGKSLNGIPLTDFFIDFGSSGISPFISCVPSQLHMINLNTTSGLPETFYFRFYNQGNTVLALGEINNKEIGLLKKNLVELNMELNNLTRDLHKRNAELNNLNELKNELLGIAAHDLRNPISIIMGYCDFLMDELKDGIPSQLFQMLIRMHGSCEFMFHLLNDMLDFSAIESGKLNLNLQPADLIALVQKSTSLNSVVAEKKNIHINFECAEQFPHITIDILKIEQVLNNLLSNAIKFSMPGTTIRVSAEKRAGEITVAIADQGPGIPADEIEQMFNPFQVTSVRTTGGEKSTGLGLAIVRKIIQGHQGKIWVESIVGTGSIFYFSLPIK